MTITSNKPSRYLTGDGKPLTSSDRCCWCGEFTLQEDMNLPDRIDRIATYILWCAACEQVAAVAVYTPTDSE